jgi:hypothetical protein
VVGEKERGEDDAANEKRSVRLAEKSWLKILFTNVLREKNTIR